MLFRWAPYESKWGFMSRKWQIWGFFWQEIVLRLLFRRVLLIWGSDNGWIEADTGGLRELIELRIARLWSLFELISYGPRPPSFAFFLIKEYWDYKILLPLELLRVSYWISTFVTFMLDMLEFFCSYWVDRVLLSFYSILFYWEELLGDATVYLLLSFY